MKAVAIVKVSLYKTMRFPPKLQACNRQNGQYRRLPSGPRWKTAGTGDFPAARGKKRPVRARSPAASEQSGRYVQGPRRAQKPRPIRLQFSAAPKKAADTFTVFSGPPKNGRYVYGFQRGPKKRPIRLRFSAGPKKTADTFTVFGTSPTPSGFCFEFSKGARCQGRHFDKDYIAISL